MHIDPISKAKRLLLIFLINDDFTKFTSSVICVTSHRRFIPSAKRKYPISNFKVCSLYSFTLPRRRFHRLLHLFLFYHDKKNGVSPKAQASSPTNPQQNDVNLFEITNLSFSNSFIMEIELTTDRVRFYKI